MPTITRVPSKSQKVDNDLGIPSSFINALNNVTQSHKTSSDINDDMWNLLDKSEATGQIENAEPFGERGRVQNETQNMLTDARQLAATMADNYARNRGWYSYPGDDPDLAVHMKMVNDKSKDYINAIMNDPVYQSIWAQRINPQRTT